MNERLSPMTYAVLLKYYAYYERTLVDLLLSQLVLQSMHTVCIVESMNMAPCTDFYQLEQLRAIHLTFRNTTDASNHDPDKSVGGGDYESYYQLVGTVGVLHEAVDLATSYAQYEYGYSTRVPTLARYTSQQYGHSSQYLAIYELVHHTSLLS